VDVAVVVAVKWLVVRLLLVEWKVVWKVVLLAELVVVLFRLVLGLGDRLELLQEAKV
jgi:hypothetical protein